MSDKSGDIFLVAGIFAIAWAWLRKRGAVAPSGQPLSAPPPVGGFSVAPGYENPFAVAPAPQQPSAPVSPSLVSSFFGSTQQPAAPVIPDVISLAEARALASEIIRSHFGNRIDPAMVTAMIEIESGFRPKAYRYEAHLKDASYGLMQVLSKTAVWLHDDLRYRAYSVASGEEMNNPAVGVYFGCAFIDWLRKHPWSDGTEDWLVMAYNGGPGNVGKFTTPNHLAKYKAAKARQAQVK